MLGGALESEQKIYEKGRELQKLQEATKFQGKKVGASEKGTSSASIEPGKRSSPCSADKKKMLAPFALGRSLRRERKRYGGNLRLKARWC